MIYYDENMSQVTFNTQETATKVVELEKKIEQKESKELFYDVYYESVRGGCCRCISYMACIVNGRLNLM